MRVCYKYRMLIEEKDVLTIDRYGLCWTLQVSFIEYI